MKLSALLLATSFAFSVQAKTLSCTGTEPFWGAQINLETGLAQVADPINLEEKTYQTKITSAAGTGGDYAFIAEGEGLLLSVVSNETCTDGMSEETYTHSVMMVGYSDLPFMGCCK